MIVLTTADLDRIARHVRRASRPWYYGSRYSGPPPDPADVKRAFDGLMATIRPEPADTPKRRRTKEG